MFTFENKQLRKYLGKIEAISSYVTLKSDNMSSLEGIGDQGECKITLEKGQIENIVIKENSESKFSLEYILPHLKAMPGSSLQSLEFSSNKPLRIDSKLFNIGRCFFYLAPRIETD